MIGRHIHTHVILFDILIASYLGSDLRTFVW